MDLGNLGFTTSFTLQASDAGSLDEMAMTTVATPTPTSATHPPTAVSPELLTPQATIPLVAFLDGGRRKSPVPDPIPLRPQRSLPALTANDPVQPRPIIAADQAYEICRLELSPESEEPMTVRVPTPTHYGIRRLNPDCAHTANLQDGVVSFEHSRECVGCWRPASQVLPLGRCTHRSPSLSIGRSKMRILWRFVR